MGFGMLSSLKLYTEMTDWKSFAAALDPPIPQEALPSVIVVLEKLDAALEPLAEALPIDTLPWNGARGA